MIGLRWLPRRLGGVLPCVAAYAGLFCGAEVGAEETRAKAALGPKQREVLVTYCVKCHNDKKAGGQQRLDDLPLEIGDLATAERWQKVLGALNSGSMPPEDEPQLPGEVKAKFLEVLSKQMVVARKVLADTGGVVTMRRLNRREYVHTMRELLDVEVNPVDLPGDENGGTFDTIGAGLFFSSDQFEHYLRIGRIALDDAIVAGERPEKRSERRQPEEAENRELNANYAESLATMRKTTEWRRSGKPPSEFGWVDEEAARTWEWVHRDRVASLGTKLRDPFVATGKFLKPLPWPDVNPLPGSLPPGKYVLRARLGYPPDRGPKRKFLEWGVQGDQGWPAEMKLFGHREIEGTLEKPEVVELPIVVARTGHRYFGIRDRQHNNGEAAEIQQWWGKTYLKNEHSFWRGLWIDWVEWEGPFVDRWPPRSHELALGGVDLNASPGDEEARQVIQSFAGRAFRGRPVREEFVAGLMAQYADRRAAGEPFATAIKTPLSIVLASPAFLYIVESTDRSEDPASSASTASPAAASAAVASAPASSKTTGARTETGADSKRVPLTENELANRLAYFLWSSPPDERLLSIAAARQLKAPNRLRGEVDRMLADEKTMRFIGGFAHQWLHMVRLDFFQFNPRLYPNFDATAKSSARREVYETLRYVLDENLPLGTLLKSDFVVVNDVLADYYGLDGVRGGEFRKTPVPDSAPRGGLLGMAAILAMGSDGERSSPVERGAWVLRKLLHDPPPPAPPNVPQLSRFAGKLMSARELITAHQEQPQCAQCHRRIDPIGYALQNFDAAGNWRTEEYVDSYRFWKVIDKKATFPIDATGELPDGSRFDGFFGLRDAVAKHEAAFARGFVEHLVEYALGRPIGFSDEELVVKILERSKPEKYTPRAVIREIVSSKEFLSK